MTLETKRISRLVTEAPKLCEKLAEHGNTDAAAKITFKARGKQCAAAADKRAVALEVKFAEAKAAHALLDNVALQLKADLRKLCANPRDLR